MLLETARCFTYRNCTSPPPSGFWRETTAPCRRSATPSATRTSRFSATSSSGTPAFPPAHTGGDSGRSRPQRRAAGQAFRSADFCIRTCGTHLLLALSTGPALPQVVRDRAKHIESLGPNVVQGCHRDQQHDRQHERILADGLTLFASPQNFSEVESFHYTGPLGGPAPWSCTGRGNDRRLRVKPVRMNDAACRSKTDLAISFGSGP